MATPPQCNNGQTHYSESRQESALLMGVAEAARQLLAVKDFDAAVSGALAAIATAANIDRIYVVENFVERKTHRKAARMICEWAASKELEVSNPDGPSIYQDDFEEQCKLNAGGKPYQVLVRNLPKVARDIQKQYKALSLCTVPIMCEGIWWGVIGFNDCTAERVWSEAEVAVLETAAACLGSAIERDQMQQARKQAECIAIIERERAARADELEAANRVLLIRDKWLQTTAFAANELLATADTTASVNAALTMLGENLECDRLGVMRHQPNSIANDLGDFHLLYEWDALGTAAQMDDDALAVLPASDFAEWTQRLMAGEAVGGQTEAQSEPFRSKLRSLNTLSAYAVPIFVGSETAQNFWGLMFMDYCRQTRQLTSAELAVFRTAATCVGGAIYRERVQQQQQQIEKEALIRDERERAATEKNAELEAHNQSLKRRDLILAATASAAGLLLAEQNFDQVVGQTLKLVGEALETYTIGTVQVTGNLSNPESLHWAVTHSWHVESGIDKATPERPLEHGPCSVAWDWYETLSSGRNISVELADMPEFFRQYSAAQGITSTHGVPIFIAGKYWGMMAFSDSESSPRRTSIDFSTLETTAACIGSAIERRQLRQAELRNQQAREVAEREALLSRERAARAAELEAANAVLRTRDRWLKTTAAVANQLLSTTYVEASVTKALQTIGKNLECDRVFVFQSMEKPDASLDNLRSAKMTYEWFSEGLDPHIHNPDIAEVSGEKFRGLVQQILSQEWYGGIVDELPEPMRSYQRSLGVKSLCTVPVMINGEMWGVVGINHCRQAKRISAAEIAVFRTAATCIGSAIYQAQVRADRAAQERAKLLGSVAEAANLLLRSADFTEVLPEVTRLLGEAVGSDRCAIVASSTFPISPSSHLRLLSEWCSNGIPMGLEATPGLANMVWRDFPDLYEQLISDEPANYLVVELSEPCRSLLEAQGTGSVVYLPITVNGLPWGQIGFDNCGQPRLYDNSEIAILKVAAESIASAVARQAQDEALRNAEKAVLQEREKAASDRAVELASTNEAIAQTLTTLTEAPELDEFLGQILTQIVKKVGATYANLFLYDAEAHTLNSYISLFKNTLYSGSAPDAPSLFHQPIPADITDFWQAIVTDNKPIIIDENHPQNVKFCWPGTRAWHQSQGHRSSTCLCLKIGDQPIGFVGFTFHHLTTLSTEQLAFIQALANQATLSIHLTQLAEKSKSAALSVALTEERNRLAREIHDTLAQAFTGVSLQLEAAKDTFDDSGERALYHVDRAGSLARRGLSEARRSVRALRSAALTTDALHEALTTALTEMTQDSPTTAYVRILGNPYPLPEDIQTDVLRIGQEATTNALRHAEASALHLILEYKPSRLRMTISDNGKGCEISLDKVEGFGILGMRERVMRFDGRFSLVGTPGEGTVIDISIPVAPAG